MALSRQEEKALFRFNIIFPLLNPALENGERTKMINDICSSEYVIPYSSKRTLSANTIWKWYHTYIESGTIDSLVGWRRAIAHERRTKIDWAEQMIVFVDIDYADADKIVLGYGQPI